MCNWNAEWARRLDAALEWDACWSRCWHLLLALALVAVTFNTIRLQILTRRDEIEVSKLIGATNPFIRRPFLYLGALQGLAGGCAAWVIVTLAAVVLNVELGDLATLYARQFNCNPWMPPTQPCYWSSRPRWGGLALGCQ